MEDLKYKHRDLFRIRSAANAFIVLLLGGLLINCNEAETAVNGNKAAGAIDDPPALTCEAGGVAVEFKTGTKGYIQGDAAQCVLPGAKTTEVTANHYSGFVFERWTNGEEQRLEETLVIENPSEAQTWTAEFSTSGLSTVWLAYSFVKQSQVYLEDFVKETKNSEGLVVSEGLGFNEHTDTIFTNSGCKGSPGFMRVEAETEFAAETPNPNKNGYNAAVYLDDPANAGKIDNLVLTYYPHVGSTFEDYKYWIDKLRVYNKNARVFIVTPWSRGPETSHSLHSKDSNCEHVWADDAKDENGNFINIDQYTSKIYVKENDNSAVDIEKEVYYSEDESILASLPNFKKNVLSKLEAEFDNKIIIVPQIALASRILQAQYQNTLSYGDDPNNQATLNITGDPDVPATMDTSIFIDETGHGSTILRLSTAMLYASYLYDEDIDTEAYRSGLWDSKDEYINAGTGNMSTDFDHKLSYFQGLDLVDLVSDIYNGEDTTEYQCPEGYHRVTLRADYGGEITGHRRQCIKDGENTVQATAEATLLNHEFDKWSDDNSNPSRTLENITSEITLTAQYKVSGYRTVWLANDMVRYSVPYLRDIAISAQYNNGMINGTVDTDHEDILFYDEGKIDDEFSNMTLRNLREHVINATSGRTYDDGCNLAGCQAFEYLKSTAEINNLVLVHSNVTYSDDDITALKYWIREAMRKSPEVRIFILIPWHYNFSDWSAGNGNDFDHYWGSTAEANNDLADLLKEIRDLVPLNEVKVIPQMRFARSIHEDDTFAIQHAKVNTPIEAILTISNCSDTMALISYFSYAQGCVSDDGEPIFIAKKAIPGPVLSVPSALLYMSYLYDQPISKIKQDNGQTVVNKVGFDFADSDANSDEWGGGLDANLINDIGRSLSAYGTNHSGTFTSYSFETTLDGIYNSGSDYNP